MVRTLITSKGQTTVPHEFRQKWQTREVVWELCEDGSARVRPLPDVMELFGAAGNTPAKDPEEKNKARAAMGRKS